MIREDGPGDPAASPCIGICRLDERSVCVGCGRTIDEIAEWSRATEARRRVIVADASARQRAAILAEDRRKESGE
ncbi:MAG TPA: DUF1289 domain-containing protein [Nevskiaceae bacterium]|nr:DUF1289 domain-containing protein [Nevskiaceae bacterium]